MMIMKKFQLAHKIFLFSWIIIVVILSFIYLYAYISPKIILNSANRVYLYDSDENLVFESNNNNDWVSLKNISDYVKYATIISEDKSFYEHSGFDYLRIGKAIINNIKHKSIVEGASTISQQYVKNLYLDFDQKWSRKIEEAFLTVKLELRYSKDEILEGYLNTINYGQGNYGISSASKYYFNKDVSDLTLEEALMLVGIPRSPENNNPIGNYDNCVKRAKIIAKLLKDDGYIDEDIYSKLFLNKVEIYGKRERNNMSTLMYYSDAVNEELNSISSIPKSLIKSGGIKIYTTLDVNAQKKLDDSVKENTSVDDSVQVAGILINPKTGGVLALTGGKNYAISQFNRATQAKRQVGSTIKPFLYYTALQNNMTASSTFLSSKVTFVFGEKETYTPQNHSNTYANKEITMAAALAYSDNVYAVKTHLFLGEEKLVNTLKTAGLKENVSAVPSLALGATEINMMDFANSYISLANYGIYNETYFIERIEDINGNVLYKHKEKEKEVLNKDYVYIINELLTNTYNPAFIDYLNPTVIYLNSKISRKYALKSGTTENDYWIVGYNPDALMLVWAGNDMNENVDSSYSKKIKNIWCDTIEEYLMDKDDSWYQPSDNIVGIPLNAVDGTEAVNSKKTAIYYFKKGTQG